MKYEVYIAVSPSDTYYIGITSQGFEVRKQQHYMKAFSNKLETPFYKAIRKYNKNLEWFVLAENLTKSEACKLEIEYIEKYKNLYEVYNVSLGGNLPWNTGTVGLCSRTEESIRKQQESRKGYTHSKETREKISKANKGRKQPSGSAEKWIVSRNLNSFEAYSPDKQFLGIFTNMSEFARLYNLCGKKISACLKGTRKHHKKYTFKYTNQAT